MIYLLNSKLKITRQLCNRYTEVEVVNLKSNTLAERQYGYVLCINSALLIYIFRQALIILQQ